MAPEGRHGERETTKVATAPRRFLSAAVPVNRGCCPARGSDLRAGLDDALFYIEEGWVKISSGSPGGKDAVLALRGADNFFGACSLIGGHIRTTGAVALTDCTLVRLGRTAAIELIRAEPDFAESFAFYLLHQGQQDQLCLTEQLTYSSERRLALTLARLAAGAGGEISMPINQADLASMIGTTRSRVSYFMNKFRRLGYIEYSRQGFVRVHKSLRSVDKGRRG